MSSDFSGRTTEPVKRKISVQVVSARIASAHGRCAASDACWSTNAAVCPVTRAAGSSPAPCGRAACVLDGEAPVARQEIEPPQPGRDLGAAGSDRCDAGGSREAGDRGRARRAVQDRRDRRVAAADALPVERLGDLARARGGGQRRRVDADEVDAEVRAARARRARPPTRRRRGPAVAITQAARRAQRPPEGTCCRRRGASASIRGPEPVEERGQRYERNEAGRERDEDAAEPHRVEELLREDEQAGHRRGDGERAEDDGAARAAHRRGERLRPVPVPRGLLAPARDDEQRVVDREAEPEPGDEVEREDRERCTSTAIRSPRNVSAIAPAPTSGGRNAATRPRKTQNESRRTSGNAISSARRRSRWIAAVTCRDAIAPPPSRTCGSPANAAMSRSAACFEASPPRRVRNAEHDAVLVDDASGPRRGRGRSGPARAATAAGPPVTSASTPGSASTPVRRSTSRFASRLSDERSANCADPASMRGITVLPTANATTTTAADTSVTRAGAGRDQVEQAAGHASREAATPGPRRIWRRGPGG